MVKGRRRVWGRMLAALGLGFTGSAWAGDGFPDASGPVPISTSTLPTPQTGLSEFLGPETWAGPGTVGMGAAPYAGGMGAAPYAGGMGASPYAPGAGAGAGGFPGAGAGVGAGAPAMGGLGGGAASSGLGGFEGAAGGGGAFTMLGDLSPIVTIRQTGGIPNPPPIPPIPPPGPNPPGLPNVARSILSPSVRGLKITENMSPIPQDRFFFNFNYFYNVNKDLNNFFQSPVVGINIWREIFGFEKTFNRGLGSIGVRLPLDTITAIPRPGVSGVLPVGGTFTSTGNLSVFLKHVLWADPRAGHVVSAGFAINTPTGPSQFAGAPYLIPTRTVYLQPFLGYYFQFGKLYLHGFTAFDAPTDPNLPTYWYNDLGVGYYVYYSESTDRILTAFAPTFEVHVNNPLNHRNEYSRTDLFGAPDVVNLTLGGNFELFGRAVLTGAVVTPVTGPNPFDVEALALLNIRFGPGPRGGRGVFPVIGQ
jgi:hypothetical protein